ncbi:hypothetical protein [Virgibacillus sp. JSM 102003]|uniref:hypothetical protein n=1 Tax=Virgibacillus sp. JSM 102003 TaxID=1562108 RepID=UPI0035C0809B
MDVILIILAIIGGLAGFLKDKSENDTNKQKRTVNSPKPSPTPSGGAGGMTRNDYQQQSSEEKTSIEEQQQEQRERLADRMNTATQKAIDERKHDAIINENDNFNQTDKELSVEQKRFKRRIKNNLNRKGLVNGVIMAEVLGSPRAKKPYQSIVKQRRN